MVLSSQTPISDQRTLHAQSHPTFPSRHGRRFLDPPNRLVTSNSGCVADELSGTRFRKFERPPVARILQLNPGGRAKRLPTVGRPPTNRDQRSNPEPSRPTTSSAPITSNTNKKRRRPGSAHRHPWRKIGAASAPPNRLPPRWTSPATPSSTPPTNSTTPPTPSPTTSPGTSDSLPRRSRRRARRGNKPRARASRVAMRPTQSTRSWRRRR